MHIGDQEGQSLVALALRRIAEAPQPSAPSPSQWLPGGLSGETKAKQLNTCDVGTAGRRRSLRWNEERQLGGLRALNVGDPALREGGFALEDS